MITIKDLYKSGIGPSSSHTMGPVKAVEVFLQRYPNANSYHAPLYGSLALTGKGHGTDKAIVRAFGANKVEVVFDLSTNVPHPNTMDLVANFDGSVQTMRVFSVGGGSIAIEGESQGNHQHIYPHKNFEQIKAYCKQNNLRLWQYVEQVEGEGIYQYLQQMWQCMCNAINQGLQAEGILDGGLNVVRRAKKLLKQLPNESPRTYENRMVAAYAFAVCEQNASGGQIVTAPTCGACGVLPAVFYYEMQNSNLTEETIMHGLMT
ncbi:MAG: L-serine ammonia-lyase, iron-sulfur-dependent, subunit alpha, partial [Clostridia bacterium]|nr:L-serine ammonia-lyase, iron-sulfur-dependent, subunit alpha [Clostridia bacterium]